MTPSRRAMASDRATSYEIIRNFDRAAPWEPNPRHLKGFAAQRIMEYSCNPILREVS
jgi:hypothetical protein